MEFLILIGGGIIVLVLSGIVALVLVLNLRSRVRRLEQSIGGKIPRLEPKSNYQTQSSLQSQPQQFNVFTPNQSSVVSLQVEPTSSNKFTKWLKEDWLMKLGALLLLIGFGWLTTYAFLNNWIGPMGRIAIGIIAGTLFILLGWWRIKKFIHQGGIFLVLGSTIILLTIFAAREIYDFFTPLSALAVMFLSTALVALASVKYNSRSLALSSLILAGIAPLLTNAPSSDYTSLFFYLLVVVLGTVWVTVLTGRRELTTAALILVTLYSLSHLFSFTSADTGTLLLFAYAFSAIFFLTNSVGILKLKDKEIIPDLITAAGNGLFLLIWIMVAAQDEWKSLIIIAWMLVFVIGAFLIFRMTQRREPFYVYAGIGVAMLAAATSIELKGATLIIAYTIESTIITLITYFVLRDIKIVKQTSFLLIWPAILSIDSINSYAWTASVIHKDFFVLLLLSLTFLGLGLFFSSRTREAGDEKSQFKAILLIVGSIYAYILLWLSLHAALQDDNTAVMISLVVYTIIGIISYFYGMANDKRSLRLYGGTLIGFVVGRLLLADVWRMELAGRIITFFLIGALLMSTAFLGKKKENSNLSNKVQ